MTTRSPHALERPLSTSEATFHALNAAGGFLGTQVALVEGPLALDLLDAALTHVQERHPVLRARIVGAAAPRWTTPASGAPPLFVTRVGADPVAIAEAELHRGFRADAEPLWRCTLVPTADARIQHLVLSNHHALADGRSAWRILADVLETCSALNRGAPLPPYLPPGRSLDDLLPPVPWPARVRHRLRRYGGRLRSAASTAPPAELALDHRRSRLLPIRVPARLVGALLEAARAHQTTLTGALAAALVAALAEAGPEERQLRLSHAVSMRQLATVPLPEDEVGCFATNLPTRHDLDRLPAPWALAAAVSQGLRLRMERGDVLAGVAASRDSFPRALAQAHRLAQLGRLGMAALSNRGVLPIPEMAPFTLRSWFGATGNHALGDALHLSCSTVHGDLSIGLVHVEPLVTRTRAEMVLHHFLRALGAMAEAPVEEQAVRVAVGR